MALPYYKEASHSFDLMFFCTISKNPKFHKMFIKDYNLNIFVFKKYEIEYVHNYLIKYVKCPNQGRS